MDPVSTICDTPPAAKVLGIAILAGGATELNGRLGLVDLAGKGEVAEDGGIDLFDADADLAVERHRGC